MDPFWWIVIVVVVVIVIAGMAWVTSDPSEPGFNKAVKDEMDDMKRQQSEYTK